jgi:hypothetical protein
MQDKDILPLVKCFIENGELGKARLLVDTPSDQSFPRAEPAYYLCKAFREKENYALAYYYYLLASKKSTSKPAGRLPGEEAVHDYLLDYEKSIIWYYVGALSDRSTRRHGLSLCMNLLENPLLPSNLASIVYNNIPVYTQSLRGHRTLLRAEKNENDPWRFSTPTFLDSHVLLREVNYFAAEDGSYHVSQDSQVKTRVLVDGSDQYIKIQESEDFRIRIAERGWHHPEAYVQGLEDTRFKSTFDYKSNSSVTYTLSASKEYSCSANHMSQLLGVIEPDTWTLTIQDIIRGPFGDRTEKNWVFVNGIESLVYEWYPFIRIGHIDRDKGEFVIDRSIKSPLSFLNMRGSTNGILHRNEWWFVTHMVKHRSGRRRIYTHRIVILNFEMSQVLRYSLPFTFNSETDMEYCLGLKADNEGLTFGYSVRDKSSWTLQCSWGEIEQYFDDV